MVDMLYSFSHGTQGGETSGEKPGTYCSRYLPYGCFDELLL